MRWWLHRSGISSTYRRGRGGKICTNAVHAIYLSRVVDLDGIATHMKASACTFCTLSLFVVHAAYGVLELNLTLCLCHVVDNGGLAGVRSVENPEMWIVIPGVPKPLQTHQYGKIGAFPRTWVALHACTASLSTISHALAFFLFVTHCSSIPVFRSIDHAFTF